MTRVSLPGKLKLLLTIPVLFAACLAALAQSTPFTINDSPLPPPTGFVNDYAGVVDPATKQRLETLLKDFKESTDPPVEIAVAVVKTTGDRQIFEYSLAVARGWKIGSKSDDNPGALLLVAIDDRKYFTQVSKDLEDELPDGVVGNLQRQFLVPEFKKGNYSKGIADTVEAYIATIRAKGSGTTAPPPVSTQEPSSNGGEGSVFSTFCCGLIILIIILIIITRSNRGGPSKGDRDRWGGGGFGGGGGGGSALPWIIGSILAGSGSSSGSSSSSGWGDSSGSGGFGGFGGGGNFGGGGAGGDW
jgi:uncharacterized protein